MAFLAGMLFALAGFLELAIGLAGRGPFFAMSIAMGALFVCVAMMWVAIGAKWRKAAERK